MEVKTVGRCTAYVDKKLFIDTEDVLFWSAKVGHMFNAHNVNNENWLVFSVPNDKVADGAPHDVNLYSDGLVWAVFVEDERHSVVKGNVTVTFEKSRKKATVNLNFMLDDGRHVTGILEAENH